MERVGIFFKLKPGKKEAYVKRHAELPDDMREVLDAAGLRNFTIWNEGSMLFAYYEVKDRQRAQRILDSSAVYSKWRKDMEEYVYIEPESGQKEWFMDCVFLHE